MKLTVEEFSKICAGIREDRDSIIKHNPIGTDEEILLWMLLSSLTLYLGLSDLETPCFTGRPDAGAYRDAIKYVLRPCRQGDFDIGPYLDNLVDK